MRKSMTEQKTFSICNLGCKVNAYEAESVASMLEEAGWQRVSFSEKADAALIFTCAVTNVAASKSRKMMHRIRREAPECVIVMAGCYAQVQDGMLEDAEILVGTEHKKDIPAYLDSYFENHEKIRAFTEMDEIPFDDLAAAQSESKSRAFLKVQDGCNQFCSYCIIPYVRGRERSMAPDKAVREAVKLSRTYHEIVLTGIHTGRYGKEHGETLSGLIRRILAEDSDLERIRISSIEITEITDDLIRLMQSDERIARHLHIPLQAGADSTLRRMNRLYSTAGYYDRIEWIRKEIPDIAISCDLIVGFPEETDADFEETYAFLKKCRFSFLHVFPYSLRKGTPAAEMKQVAPEIKKERSARCLALSEELADRQAEAWVGRTVSVMCEQTRDGYTEGYDSHYMHVKVRGSHPKGRLLRCRITEYRDRQLYAEEEYETE